MVQSDDLLLSTVLVAPMSRLSIAVSLPADDHDKQRADPGPHRTNNCGSAGAPWSAPGHVSQDELDQISEALRLALALD